MGRGLATIKRTLAPAKLIPIKHAYRRGFSDCLPVQLPHAALSYNFPDGREDAQVFPLMNLMACTRGGRQSVFDAG